MERPTLPPISYAGRIERTRAAAQQHGVDGVLVTDLTNLRWLSAFTGSSAMLLIRPDDAVLITDGRYAERSRDEASAAGVDLDIRVGFSQGEQHDTLVGAAQNLRRLGAESTSLTHARWSQLSTDLPIEPLPIAVSEGRRRKDAGELARIACACAFADAALAEVAPRLGDGMSEADVRNELEYRMRIQGADGPSYATIVASGPTHAARPHHEPGDRTLVEGDTVVIDVGALVDGYHSDMTRSYVIGDPTRDQAALYELLLGIQLAGIAAVSAGVAAADVDATCRSMAEDAGLLDWYLHSTGHGVGLQIHEDPFESPVSTQELLVGDVVTVEPGLYRVGFGGFRIEDLVEVTADGCRVLTSTPKDKPCLPSPPTT